MALQFFSTKECEWNDLDVYVNGVKCAKVVDFEAGVKAEKQPLYAAHDEPISIQSGNRSYTGKLTLLKGAADDMWDAAVAAGGRDTTDIVFNVQGSFQAAGSRSLSTLTCTGCEVSEQMFKLAQNDKSMKVDLPFVFLGLEKI